MAEAKCISYHMKLHRIIPVAREVIDIAFSHKGELMAAGYSKAIDIWQLSSGNVKLMKELKTRTLFGSINGVAFLQRQGIIASEISGEEKEVIRIWKSFRRWHWIILKDHSEYVNSVAFSPDKKLIAAGSDDGTVCIWNLDDAALLYTIGDRKEETNLAIKSVAFSPDGKLLAAGSMDTIRVWRTSDWELTGLLKGHSAIHISFSKDGNLIAAGSNEGDILIWQVSEEKPLKILSGHRATVKSLSFSPDGKFLASAAKDYSVRLWMLSNGEMMDVKHGLVDNKEGHTACVNAVEFSPDGRFISSGSDDRRIMIWKVVKNKSFIKEVHDE